MATPSVTPAVTPVEIKLGDGSVIKGATYEEAIQVAVKRVEDNQAAYREQKKRADEAEAEAARLRDSQAKPAVQETGAFQREKYYQMLNDDPVAAQNYIDQHRFGTADPVGDFNRMRAQIDDFNQQAVVASFTAQHADFPGGPDAARNLTDRFNQLRASGFPFTVDTLNYAYSQALADGSIKPLEANAEEREIPNPSLTGSSGGQMPDDIARADQMSDADLEKLLRSRGVLR